MIDLSRISQAHLETEPYRWAFIDRLFSTRDAAALTETFPNDRFKRMSHYGGDKDSEYESRALVGMREQFISGPEGLSRHWKTLADNFLSADYRVAMSSLTGLDLSAAPLEVNVFHYPPGGLLGAHVDLRDKIVTHVLYFNRSWNNDDGGCLTILRSSDPSDVVTTIAPVVGSSVVLVRSDNSWHAVTPVATNCRLSRLSLTATFYHRDAVSTMWTPGDTTALHHYPKSRAERWRRYFTTKVVDRFKR
ncbi:MAG TPA: 2OG-Fe(II) oxygenase family protein [Pyrinomonadaceae bacterium]|jgi:Rps23 Pro-64 3,4-dihydroxylase Tpa1-like proline 4-hydroxylase|nr:2OG-Fe(II) oxygenase family protein [Pyrinomonadaceae bacterium]